MEAYEKAVRFIVEVSIDDPDGVVVDDAFEVQAYQDYKVERGTVDSEFQGSPCTEVVVSEESVGSIGWFFEGDNSYKLYDEKVLDRIEKFIDNYFSEMVDLDGYENEQ